MFSLKSKRFSRVARAAAASSLIAVLGAPAVARPVAVHDGPVDMEAILNDPLGLAIGGAILLALLIAGFLTYRRLPTFAETKGQREAFWRGLPADAYGRKGVLLTDEMLGGHLGVARVFARRLVVTVRHEDPAQSTVLFRGDENPNLFAARRQDDAVKLWIDTATREGLPAVYATPKGIHMLSRDQIKAMRDDPDSFMKKLHGALMMHRPLQCT